MIQKILLVFRAIILSLSRYRLSRKAWVKIGAGTIVYITSSVTKHCRGGGNFHRFKLQIRRSPKKLPRGLWISHTVNLMGYGF